jgi:hypothetical protein
MRLQSASPKDESSVKVNAVFYPVLLLLIMPFSLALVLPIVFPYIQVYNVFSLKFYAQLANIPPDQTSSHILTVFTAYFVSSSIVALPALAFHLIYNYRYGMLGVRFLEKKFLDRKYSRIQIKLHENLNRILLYEVVAFVGMTIFLHLIDASERIGAQSFENGFFYNLCSLCLST